MSKRTAPSPTSKSSSHSPDRPTSRKVDHLKSPKITNLPLDNIPTAITSTFSLTRRSRFGASSEAENYLGSSCLMSSNLTSSATTDEDFKVLPCSDRTKGKHQIQEMFEIGSRSIDSITSSSSDVSLCKMHGKLKIGDLQIDTSDLEKFAEILPNLTYKQVSYEELNCPEEMKFIEENVKANDRLKNIGKKRQEAESFREASSESLLGVVYPKNCPADVEDNED